MKIGYKNDKLRNVCLDAKFAVRELGPDNAKKLRTRHADPAAAANVTELVAGRPHPLTGDRLGEFALDLVGLKRITFKPDHDPCPRKPDGSIDWSLVTAVTIEYIGDYHG